MHDYSPTPLFSQILIFIFSIHVLLTEVAGLVLKSFIVHWNNFTEHLTLNLLNEIIDCISVNEVPFLGIMGMEIKVEWKPIVNI